MRRSTRQWVLHYTHPNLAPFAGLFLVINCFLLLTATLKEQVNGLVKLRETPRTLCNACFNAPEHIQVFICLTASGRVSFAVSEPYVQLAVLKQIGKKYGVHFLATSLGGLRSTTFVAVKLEKLSDALAAPAYLAPAAQKAANIYALTETQLLDCIESTQALSPQLTNLPAGIYLSIHAQTKASLVLHLIKLFQQRNMNRLNLLTHCNT